MSFVKIAESFDKQQAFAAGFALAAKDAGLSSDEYETLCKVAADMMTPPLGVPPAPAPAPTGEQGITPAVAPINANNAGEAARQDFAKQKAQEAKAAPTMGPTAAQNKLSQAVDLKAPEWPPAWPPATSTPAAQGKAIAPKLQNYPKTAPAPVAKPKLPDPKVTSPGAIAPGLMKWMKERGLL